MVRVPVGCLSAVQQYISHYKDGCPGESSVGGKLYPPLFSSRIPAGFASPADDDIETRLDLNQHLIKNPSDTFFLSVEGESMIGAGIHEGDLLIVDRSVDPQDGSIVIASLNGEVTVKRLRIETNKSVTLQPENPNYPCIVVKPETDFNIWGVVTSVIHQF
ncbi:translesion error-prone DNA polymerase V autoproteolytic subunit [Candidatus Thiothrix sp. Deng01]|uniref:Translesion error-prone DNA polymerase V autoproteolytic subunit n=1 Tax=Candidatus Thiothrix phosphatis TaxID=3112415 RepID=A0ABU6CTM1_9GAMM|nr:translesion error-prone DNA polymerase V autoproteolytic subunit [Candidatus Thiothrix sp. Deng01]MEB4590135.1 translesion error-prone DNA polymerase V autoproteolytic subunit [Candidatus Thiothrix sp. Deng01]